MLGYPPPGIYEAPKSSFAQLIECHSFLFRKEKSHSFAQITALLCRKHCRFLWGQRRGRARHVRYVPSWKTW